MKKSKQTMPEIYTLRNGKPINLPIYYRSAIHNNTEKESTTERWETEETYKANDPTRIKFLIKYLKTILKKNDNQ